MTRPFVWGVAVVLASGVARADIASSTVTVEFQEKQTKITPGDPTINLAASPSVVIEIQPGDNRFKVTPILARTAVVEAAEAAKKAVLETSPTSIDVLGKLDTVIRNPSSENVAAATIALKDIAEGGAKAKIEKPQADLDTAAKTSTVSANRVLLNFHRGWWWEYHSRKTPAHLQKDRVEPLADAGWDIWLRNRHYAFDFPVEIECDDSSGPPTCTGAKKRILIIHVDTASWAVAASAGILFAGLRDERYRVDAESRLIRLDGEGDVPYYAASYLHYCPINGVPVLTNFCPTLAIGTDVPSTGVVFGLGLAGHIRPLLSLNSAYLSAGVVYGPRKTLSDTYLGQSPITVPANTSAASLLTTHYAFRAFVGLSIGIAGSADKFRGLYPGSKGAGSETKAEPSGPK